MKKRNYAVEIFRLLWLFIISGLFILIFSESTSSLMYDRVAYDSDFFMLVGKGMTKGLMPYRDFFDMKGPYLFLIEYIGQRISYGKAGILFIQVVSFFVSLVFFDLSYRLVMKKSSVVQETVLLSGVVLLFAGTITDGNLTEEYSLPFLSVSLYMALRYFKKCDDSDEIPKHSKFCTAFYGFTFGYIVLIRITNAALIGAILLTMTVVLIKNRKTAELLKNAAAFIVGFAVAVVPMLLYYKHIGLLNEMLNDVFVFGFAYSSENGVIDVIRKMQFSQYFEIFIVGVPIVALAVLRIKDYKYWIFGISNTVLVEAAILMGNGYYHYMTIALPNVAFAIWLYAYKYYGLGNIKRIIAAVLIVAAIFAPSFRGYLNAKIDLDDVSKFIVRGAKPREESVAELIPEDERDSVYCYFIFDSTWYFYNDIFPYSKYCDWHDHYVALNPEIQTEIEEMFRTEPPKWLVFDRKKEIPEYILNIRDNGYVLAGEDERFILYNLKK